MRLGKVSKHKAEEIIKKAIGYMRSGEYVQGERHLHDDGKYCALGLIALAAGFDFEHGYLKRDPYDVAHEVLALFKLDNSIVYKMNDQDHLSFEQISNFLENAIKV